MSSLKEHAQSFLTLAAQGKVKEAFDKYVANDFRHHNQYSAGDRQSLLTAMAEAHQANPNKGIDIKHLYEDWNTVVAHSLVMRAKAEDPDIVVVHICRFVDEKIVEMWDVWQLLIPNSPNKNGIF